MPGLTTNVNPAAAIHTVTAVFAERVAYICAEGVFLLIASFLTLRGGVLECCLPA